MTEEAQVTELEPAQDNADTLEVGTEATTEDEVSQEEEKHFTQDEVNAIVQKEKAKAEAKAERRALKVYAEKLESMTPRQQQIEQAKQPEGKPKLDQFQNVEDYVEAVADWKLEQREQVGKNAQAVNQATEMAKKVNGFLSEAEKTAGFNREDFDDIKVTDSMADAILDSELPAKIIVHLTANPEEATRISKLSPARQAAEIGKLEVRLSATKTVSTSKAPAPIKPIGSRQASIAGDVNKMSMDEYAAYRVKQGARWAR